MNPYPKIQSIYKRDDHGRFADEFACPEFGYLQHCMWDFTEKADGTNIRVTFHPKDKTIRIGGRTDNAQIPANLHERLLNIFQRDKLAEVFHGEDPVTLYGEGIGPKIQKGGGLLRSEPDFILFDILIGDWWLRLQDVYGLADKLNLNAVPWRGCGTIEDAVRFARDGFVSHFAETPGTPAEGLVLRPTVPLRCRDGSRVITKVKTKDFK